MQQTPIHSQHNPELLQLIPIHSNKIIEIGCSSGALAREFKLLQPNCNYLGVEIDETYAHLASQYCDMCIAQDVELATDSFWNNQTERDCWIFGDTLEHLRDPWRIIKNIRQIIPLTGCIVACIPNAQHWSLQAKLCIGDFRYQTDGLLDKTHLRWFTRQTIIELFEDAGFSIESVIPRISNSPNRESILPNIRAMAISVGADPETAISDALPLQYVIRAIPK